ncbi:hypothetical protein OC844_005393 [Tilletia horrida]|nr:hypothetical protein OC844_005393 [Tilletia horrida]
MEAETNDLAAHGSKLRHGAPPANLQQEECAHDSASIDGSIRSDQHHVASSAAFRDSSPGPQSDQARNQQQDGSASMDELASALRALSTSDAVYEIPADEQPGDDDAESATPSDPLSAPPPTVAQLRFALLEREITPQESSKQRKAFEVFTYWANKDHFQLVNSVRAALKNEQEVTTGASRAERTGFDLFCDWTMVGASAQQQTAVAQELGEQARKEWVETPTPTECCTKLSWQAIKILEHLLQDAPTMERRSRLANALRLHLLFLQHDYRKALDDAAQIGARAVELYAELVKEDASREQRCGYAKVLEEQAYILNLKKQQGDLDAEILALHKQRILMREGLVEEGRTKTAIDTKIDLARALADHGSHLYELCRRSQLCDHRDECIRAWKRSIGIYELTACHGTAAGQLPLLTARAMLECSLELSHRN